MKKVLILTAILFVFSVSCGSNSDDTGDDKGNTANSADSVADDDTANTADSANSVDDGDMTDTANSANTGNTGNSADSGNTGDTANTGDTGNSDHPYIIIPTNQIKCCNDTEEISCPEVGEDYYGQDAQYPDAERIFAVSGTAPQEIVADSLTGLIWQKEIESDERDFQDAKDYCFHLEYAGYSDWRVPSVEEFSTLIDYGRYPPIDMIFSSVEGAAFWTSTSSAYLDARIYAWHVSSLGAVDLSEKMSLHVRCVRGEIYTSVAHFIESGDTQPIVLDTNTDLEWAKKASTEEKTWKEGLSYCENLDYAGKTDWRLPNVNELKSLVNYSKSRPASDFPDLHIEPGTYLSSTHNSIYIGHPWCVNLKYGATYHKGGTLNVMCVRDK